METPSKTTSTINQFGVDTRLWKIELELLQSFHEFCISNQLNYYIVCGTALGAARHSGFIPWDDDVDVAMMREDYNKLLSLADKFNSKYKLVCYENTPSYQYQWAKLEYLNSKVIEFNYPKGPHGGIYIDIFPLDGYPTSYKAAKHKMNKNIWWKIKCNALHGYHTGVWYLKWFWPSLGFFLRLKYKNTVLFHERWDKLFSSETNNSLIIADQFGADMNEVMEKSIYGKPTPIKFENLTLFAPEHIDQYLTKVYGNWREFPPVEKRQAAHGYSFSIEDDIV